MLIYILWSAVSDAPVLKCRLLALGSSTFDFQSSRIGKARSQTFRGKATKNVSKDYWILFNISDNIISLVPPVSTSYSLCLTMSSLKYFISLLLAIPGSMKFNPATQIQVELRLNGFVPLYQQVIRDHPAVQHSQYDQLRLNAGSMFPSYFHAGNVQDFTFSNASWTVWPINPPSRNELLRLLKTNSTIVCTFSWSLQRAEPLLGSTVVGQNSVGPLDDHTKYQIYQMLTATNKTAAHEVELQGVYPRYIHALQKGNAV